MRIDRKKLVLAMMDRDLTQKELAEKAGVSRATINFIKSGKSCYEVTAKKIADALGVKVTEILED